MELDYNVIATGSSGNAVRIENIMIDCGIPFAKMEAELKKCKVLLLTHSHGDHIKKATLLKIMEKYPRILICGNPDVAYQYHVNKIMTTMPFMLQDGTKIYPFEGSHDVPVTYFVIQKNGLNILYATDTNIIQNDLGIKFDYVFLESNYDETKLKEIAKQYSRKGYDAYSSSLRHLSTQKCKEFYYLNRKSKDSPLIELHMSSRFY